MAAVNNMNQQQQQEHANQGQNNNAVIPAYTFSRDAVFANLQDNDYTKLVILINYFHKLFANYTLLLNL